MASEVQEQWKKELKILLDRVQARPSEDHSATRERINVLNQLIAGDAKVDA